MAHAVKIVTDNEFKIDRGIPFAANKRRPPKYPFASMIVGDSFAVSEDMAPKVRSASAAHGHRYNMKFSTRQFDGGFRCWRIA